MNHCLQKLGFHATDRVVVIHADDIGAGHSTIPAFETLLDVGLISCGSAMPPTPWFGEVARSAVNRPEVDLGIHLTFASEHDSYRWRPLSRHWQDSSMVDESGFFHRQHPECDIIPDVKEVLEEARFQIQYAKDHGLDPTHFDTHMYILHSPRFILGYLNLAITFEIPPLISRVGIREPYPETATSAITDLEQMGLPVFDQVFNIPLGTVQDKLEIVAKMFGRVTPGLSYFACHPSIDTPEIRAIARDWQGRIADFEVLQSEELKQVARDSGLTILGYRELAKAIKW